MKKLRIGVIYGGRSSEHEVSLASAASVIANLDRQRYDPVPDPDRSRRPVEHPGQGPGRGRGGGGHREGAAGDRAGRAAGARGVPRAAPGRGDAHHDRARDGGDRAGARTRTWPASGLDVIFPVLHGPYGEDGTVQGLLELANVPYVGSGVLASAVGDGQGDDEGVLRRPRGLPDRPAPGRRSGATGRPRPSGRRPAVGRARLGYPVFVKPANLGSSVGISKVKAGGGTGRRPSRSPPEFDRKIVVEAAVPAAREIECSVLGQRSARGVGARRDPADARVLRLRREVPGGVADAGPGAARRGADGGGAAAGHRGVPRRRGRGLRARRLPAVARDRPALRERDQHHPRLHDDQHVPEAVGGERPVATPRCSTGWSSWRSSGTPASRAFARATRDLARRPARAPGARAACAAAPRR